MSNDLAILLVDDSMAMRQTVKNTLVSMGYTNIHAAANGAEALEKVMKIEFNVIFLDWNMPEMNGLDFLKTFRGEIGNRAAAVVMLTAANDKQDILTAIENGATSYLTKPVSVEAIKKKMEHAVAWLSKNTG